MTTADTSIQIARFGNSVRKYLERTIRSIPCLMMILDPIKVIIDNLHDNQIEELDVPFNPKDPQVGLRRIPLTKIICIECEDFREEDDPNFFRLALGKWVGLLYAKYPIRAESFTKDETTSLVREIKVTYGDEKSPKAKARIHWVGDETSGKTVKAETHVFNPLFKATSPKILDWG